MNIYFLDKKNGATSFVETDALAIIKTDGSIEIKAANTPIPAAFYLMGSGLLGLVGLRRKKA